MIFVGFLLFVALCECRSIETSCSDRIDNNGNGAVDCADTIDCGHGVPCDDGDKHTHGERCNGGGLCRFELCNVPGDEDSDGLSDCDDPDCQLPAAMCSPPNEFIKGNKKNCFCCGLMIDDENSGGACFGNANGIGGTCVKCGEPVNDKKSICCYYYYLCLNLFYLCLNQQRKKKRVVLMAQRAAMVDCRR